MKNSTDDSSNSLALIFYYFIEELVDIKTNKTGEIEGKDDEKVCLEDIHHHMKIFLIVCGVMLLLCISCFIFVILKVSIHTHTNISFEKHKSKIKTKLINNIIHKSEMHYRGMLCVNMQCAIFYSFCGLICC